MIRVLKVILILLAGSFLYTSCGDSDLLDFDKLNGVKNWKPDLTLQFAYANYDVWRLVEQTNGEDSTLIQRDNQIIIRHNQKDIYQMEVGDVIRFPENLATFAMQIPLGQTTIPFPSTKVLPFPGRPVTFSFPEGDLKRVEGNVDCGYVLPATSFTYHVAITFNNILDADGQPVRVAIAEANLNNNGSFRLENVVFDMARETNRLEWEAEITIPAGETVDVNDLDLRFQLTHLDFFRVEGRMLPKTLTVAPGEFSMNVEFWDYFNGNFNFTNPSIALIVRNYGLAVPVKMQVDFTAYGENKSVALQTKNGFQPVLNGWIPGETLTVERVKFDRENSNIAELLSLPPKDKITYAIGAVAAYDPAKELVLLKDGHIGMDAEIEIPLHLAATDLVFKDTIEIDKIEDVDKIEEAKILVRAVNNIPLQLGEGNLYLLDGRKQCFDSVAVTRFIDAPEVSADGEVISSTKEKIMPPIVLTEKNIQSLSKTEYIIISVKAATSNEGKTPVIIRPDATLFLSLSLEAKANLEDVF